jgi:hypothetical protein
MYVPVLPVGTMIRARIASEMTSPLQGIVCTITDAYTDQDMVAYHVSWKRNSLTEAVAYVDANDVLEVVPAVPDALKLRQLTVDAVLAMPFRRAIKTASTKIRPITEQDVRDIGPTFLDLEGREQRVEVGRYLCIGVQGERWTCSEKSMQDRVAITELDEEGFRLYVQRDPKPVLVTLIEDPFWLMLPGDRWESTGGAITWNGHLGDQLIMRVVEKTIFEQTYQFVDGDA